MSTIRSKSMYLIATSGLICLASIAFWFWKNKLIKDKKEIEIEHKSVITNKKALKSVIPRPTRASIRVKKSQYDQWWTNLSQKRTIQNDLTLKRPSNGSRLNSDNDEISKQINKLKILFDSKNEIEIVSIVDMLIKNFKQLDSNQRIEFTSLLIEISHVQKLKLVSLVDVLNTEYSNKNLDLFDNYQFNNTLGELSTEILINFLKVIENIVQSETSCRDGIESELFCDMLWNLFSSYIFDLEKNKNNVKRLKKVQAVKYYSVKILSDFFHYFKKANFDDLRQTVYFKNTVKLANSILNGPPILVNYELEDTRNSRLEMVVIKKSDFFKIYLILVENLLFLVIENFESFSKLNFGARNFVNYLIEVDMFVEKMNSIKNDCLFKDSIDRIFDLIIELKNKLSHLNEGFIEQRCLDDISLDKELII